MAGRKPDRLGSVIPIHDDNPTRITPFVTVALIGASIAIFFYEVTLGMEDGRLFIYRYGAIPAALFGNMSLPPEVMAVPGAFSLITSMFLHGGFLHLAGNMLYLWIFGNNIEDSMGHGRFVLFYLTCGVVAALTHALTDTGSDVPMIGASGAISGVLGAYLLLYPRARVLVLFPIWIFIRLFYVPAGLVLALWFLLQLLYSAGGGGGVAWYAHIGGFIAGMVLIGFFKHRSVRFFNPPHRRTGRLDSGW
jgi:membrane associated rhomboid family serine protease